MFAHAATCASLLPCVGMVVNKHGTFSAYTWVADLKTFRDFIQGLGEMFTGVRPRMAVRMIGLQEVAGTWHLLRQTALLYGIQHVSLLPLQPAVH